MKLILSLLLTITLLSGCTTLSNPTTSARLAVQVATLKVIDENVEKARKIREIAGEARALLSDEEASIANVVSEVRELVSWGRLDASERLLVDTLLLELKMELETRIGEGILNEDQKVRVERVISWIEMAASL